MLFSRFIIALLIFGSSVIHAQKGNYKFNNFGNRSILLSGNVTGSVEDIALAYYNPSRLTEVEDTRFAFNAKAYQLTSLDITNVLGEESNENSNNFDGVPSMAGGTFNLFGTRFAYSILSKSRNSINVNYTSDLISQDILDVYPGDEEYKVNLALDTNIKDQWFGLTWATEVIEKLSLGISVFGSVYKYDGRNTVDYTVMSEAGNVAFYQNTFGFRQHSYGLVCKVGANYSFSEFDLGININLPYLEVYQEGRFNYNKTIAGIGSDSDLIIDTYFDNLEAKRKEPIGISAGAGIPIGKSKLHLNVDYISGLKSYDLLSVPAIDTGNGQQSEVLFEEERRNVFNFGAGAEIFISENFKTYGSFSTDYNALKSNPPSLNLQDQGNKDISAGANFIHGSTGIDWKLSWASIILGVTYTSGSSEFESAFRPTGPDIEDVMNTITGIKYQRWQFIIGLEFPFLDDQVKRILENN